MKKVVVLEGEISRSGFGSGFGDGDGSGFCSGFGDGDGDGYGVTLLK